MKPDCPACKRVFPSTKGIGAHARSCSKWDEVIGVPLSEFSFDAYFKRGLYADGLVEDVDYVRCRICDMRKKRLGDHLKKAHGLTSKEYKKKYNALSATPRTNRLREQTVQARYGVTNVFQSEAVKEKSKETSLKKYGVEHAAIAPVVNAKRKATNLSRYGSDNVFGSKEIQERIRQTNLERFGFENPNQCSEIMEKRKATNEKKYGEKHFLLTSEFKEKFKETSQKNWGTDHPMQSKPVQDKQAEVMMEKYGVPNPLLRSDIYKKSYKTNLKNHGGVHHTQTEEYLEKRAKTCLEKYGVDNPSKADEIKEKIKSVFMAKYGMPYPPNFLISNRTFTFPNQLEQKVDKLSPDFLVYAGDGSYWVSHKGASKVRNPDFVMLTSAQLEAYRSGTDLNLLRTHTVLEVFGDYWHGPTKTGLTREAHKRDVIEYYRKCGIRCLVIWESEIKKNPKRIAHRIFNFLYE